MLVRGELVPGGFWFPCKRTKRLLAKSSAVSAATAAVASAVFSPRPEPPNLPSFRQRYFSPPWKWPPPTDANERAADAIFRALGLTLEGGPLVLFPRRSREAGSLYFSPRLEEGERQFVFGHGQEVGETDLPDCGIHTINSPTALIRCLLDLVRIKPPRMGIGKGLSCLFLFRLLPIVCSAILCALRLGAVHHQTDSSPVFLR